MSKGDTFENDLLLLVFNGTTIANIAANTSTSPATQLTVALHTADPGESGTQSTNEIAYTGYARAAVLRVATGWAVTGNSVSPVATISFPSCTGGSGTVTHFSVGTGTGDKLLYSGTVTPNISVTTGVTPQLSTASTITED